MSKPLKNLNVLQSGILFLLSMNKDPKLSPKLIKDQYENNMCLPTIGVRYK